MSDERQTDPGQFLDASILDDQEVVEVEREEIKLNAIEFEFPDGLAKVDIFEECRALCDLGNFDVMYDMTMQLLTGKRLVINLKREDGTKFTLGKIYIQDKYQDLRGMDCVADYPWIVNWLTEFMAAYLGKKFPRRRDESALAVSEPEMKRGKQPKSPKKRLKRESGKKPL